jgi:hypothetical protein
MASHHEPLYLPLEDIDLASDDVSRYLEAEQELLPGCEGDRSLRFDEDYPVINSSVLEAHFSESEPPLPPPRLRFVDVAKREYEPESDMNALVLRFIPEMLELAKARRQEAESYRVSVGSALMASRQTSRRSELIFLSDSNFKASPQVEKHCAEMGIVERARKEGCTRIEAIVVAGPSSESTIKSISRVDAKTLHPCDVCRGICRCSPLIDNDTMIITYSNARGGIYQAQSFGELDARYKRFEQTGHYQDLVARPYKHSDWSEREKKYTKEVTAFRYALTGTELDDEVLRKRRELTLSMAQIAISR